MSTDKLRTVYIVSLLILSCLLVLFAQGTFAGLYGSSEKPIIEIDRVDLYNDFFGNYSKVSVMIANNDTLTHNFTIGTFFDEELVNSFNVTVADGKTFTYKVDVLTDRIPISENETIESTIKVAKFAVYVDEQTEPIEDVHFVFREE